MPTSVNSPGLWRGCKGVGPLIPINHWLNATAYLSILADDAHPFMAAIYQSSSGYFKHDNAPCHKPKVISNWFHEHDMSSMFCCLPSLLIPIENLWDEVEWETQESAPEKSAVIA